MHTSPVPIVASLNADLHVVVGTDPDCDKQSKFPHLSADTYALTKAPYREEGEQDVHASFGSWRHCLVKDCIVTAPSQGTSNLSLACALPLFATMDPHATIRNLSPLLSLLTQ